MKTLADSGYAFFLENAGYSYDPKTQTPAEGRQECARLLAEAERRAKNYGYRFSWDYDDITNEEFSDEKPAYRLWVCSCYDWNGNLLSALGGVDFGADGTPAGDTHARVIEAELAAETAFKFHPDGSPILG